MSPFETHLETTARSRDVMQMAEAMKPTPLVSSVSHTVGMKQVTAYVIALVLSASGLFGFNAWAQWLTDNNPDARDFFSSPGFTAFVLIGGAFVSFLTTIVVASLLFVSDSPSGRPEPEDHA